MVQNIISAHQNMLQTFNRALINQTGVLGIHPLARDIKIDNFSVTFYGAELLQDTKLELSCGNR